MIRAIGLLAAAAVAGVGAWQVAAPTDAPIDRIEVAADAPQPAPDLSTDDRGDAGNERDEDARDDRGANTDAPVVSPPRPVLTPTAPEPAPAPATPARIVAAPVVADPTSVSIPALGVDAPVDEVALEADGSMEVPHDIARVGWYEPGVRPGENGSAVIAGHVDSRTQGRGALWGLKSLDAGDAITVGHQDGQASSWQVTSRNSHVKEELPIDELFTRFGDRRLVLITCGGSFDAARGRYTHNIVVIAEPVEPAA